MFGGSLNNAGNTVFFQDLGGVLLRARTDFYARVFRLEELPLLRQRGQIEAEKVHWTFEGSHY